MSTMTRPARTLTVACGALFATCAPAQAQALPAPLTTLPAAGTVTAAPVPAPLTAAGLDHLLDRARARSRAKRRPRALTTAPSRRLVMTKRGRAIAPAGAPSAVRRLVQAANRISHKPYVWGGGHGSWQSAGYDCSGSVGYALHAAGVLRTSVTSGALESFGRPGRGRWVTVYANGGHTYMVVAGLRFDTTAYKATGSRWTRDLRDHRGYVVRHPAGL